MTNRILLIPILVSLAIPSGCGTRHTTGSDRNAEAVDGGPAPEVCTADIDCPEGSCIDGACMSEDSGPTGCSQDQDCEPGEYCHFPAGTTYDPGAEGICDEACRGPEDCEIGQECIDGRCYTNYDCDPANYSCDCPGGEICSPQTLSCTAPPTSCYFNEQCPCDWLCNATNTCVNPTNLGNCTQDSDCETIAGCEGGNCECQDGACAPTGACAEADDCPAGQYCANGICQPAPPCDETNGDEQCSPYNLICDEDSGNCTNPEPCEDGTCPPGFVCRETVNPPSCFPEGAGQCSVDSQCPAGEYCELFTNTCVSGCRDNADCSGQCPGASVCNCNNAHQCVGQNVGSLGDTCGSDLDCPGGTICAYNDPDAGLTCSFGIPMGDCSQSCRQVCDILTSQIMETCPAGQTCGGENGLANSLIMQLFGSALGNDENTSVCY